MPTESLMGEADRIDRKKSKAIVQIATTHPVVSFFSLWKMQIFLLRRRPLFWICVSILLGGFVLTVIGYTGYYLVLKGILNTIKQCMAGLTTSSCDSGNG